MVAVTLLTSNLHNVDSGVHLNRSSRNFWLVKYIAPLVYSDAG